MLVLRRVQVSLAKMFLSTVLPKSCIIIIIIIIIVIIIIIIIIIIITKKLLLQNKFCVHKICWIQPKIPHVFWTAISYRRYNFHSKHLIMLTFYPITNSSSALIILTTDITEAALLAVRIRIKALESSPF